MLKKNIKNKTKKKQTNIENLQKGIKIIREHPLFGRCLYYYTPSDSKHIGTDVYATVSSDGTIYANSDAAFTPKQWAYIIAHNILHLAFGHFDADKMPGYMYTDENGNKSRKNHYSPIVWNMACDIYVDKFLSEIKFGQSIHPNTEYIVPGNLDDEIKIYNYLIEKEIDTSNNIFGTSAVGNCDMKGINTPIIYDTGKGMYNKYTRQFSIALAQSVSTAVSVAAGYDYDYTDTNKSQSPGKDAAKWFINHYPLLGGLAAHFNIIEDYNYCYKNDIQIAAIDVSVGELYINPGIRLSTEEWKFVLAHEYLHAGLLHHKRCIGRDHYLWNIACDFVINEWLIEMGVGSMPSDVLLYDPELKGLSAENVYDLILSNIRKYSKLNTLRGYHKCDFSPLLNNDNDNDNIHIPYKNGTNSVTLDEFCRDALQQGLEYHIEDKRGLIPSGLIEEIRALSMPPIPWDVALAKWFDVYFAPLEKHRSYARPSRRQASTPNIPRPRYCPYDVPTDSRTFGVVIDTSGSMDTNTIGKALGSIASYSAAHDVPFARVVFCDAKAYDAGYISPEDIAGKVAVQGRGGTILQPGIDALEKAKDFPYDGPILIITDGMIENKLYIHHEHAFLLPKGNRLPFRTKAEMFYFD